MYFDTLKISTLEQSASQTSARGGVGNPHLITWDFDKEIKVKLEDALYSPASQSLMWGGLFGVGKQKIYGAWDPYVYEKDKFGKPIYLVKEVISEVEYEELEPEAQLEYVKFICPCDEQIKYIRYIQADGKYKYASKLTYKDGRQDTEGRDTEGRFIGSPYKSDEDYENGNKTIYEKDILPNVYISPTIYTSEYMKARPSAPEAAEIIMDNFGNFDYRALYYKSLDEDSVEAEYIELDGNALGIKDKYCGDHEVEELEYEWTKSDIKMVSFMGDQDVYYSKDVGIRYRTPIDQIEKTIMLSQRKLWDMENNKEITEYNEKDIAAGAKYQWIYNPYDSKIDFYINLQWPIPVVEGTKIYKYSKIKVGTFYILEDLNINNQLNNMIYPINYGIEDVPFLDRMEKCIATDTFVINTDRNLRMQAYSQLPQYSQSELTVYINPMTMKPYETNIDHFHRRNGDIVKGNLCMIKKDSIYYKWTRRRAPKDLTLGRRIVINATTFPGAFRLVGETWARAREDSQDQRYQIEIPLCKMSSNTNLTLEAAGEPATFNMEFNVLQKQDGVMVKLTQYDIKTAMYDGYCSASHEIIPVEPLNIRQEYEPEDSSGSKPTISSINIVSPPVDSVYCVPIDCQVPYGDGKGHQTSDAITITPNGSGDIGRQYFTIQATMSDGTVRYLTEEEFKNCTIEVTQGAINI